MMPFLAFILEAGCSLALFYAVYRIFLRRETYFHLNRLFLVSGLILSFLIPAFPVASPFKTLAAATVIDPAASPLSPAPAFSPAIWLEVVYLAGVLLFLLRLGGHLAKLGLVVRRRGVRRFHGLKIVAVEQEFSPFSFLRLVFVNQGSAGASNLRRILAHERVHIAQFHSLDVLLMEIVLSLQWFNPFVWPYKKALQETHEYLADAGVIAQGFSSVNYRRLMFEQHVGARLFEFGNDFKQSQIKRRISMLSKIPSSRAARLKLLLALPLTLALVLAFAEPRAVAGPSGPQEKAVSSDSAVKAKIAQAVEEYAKLSTLTADLKKKLESTVDETVGNELKKKLEFVFQKRIELAAFLKKAGALPAGGEESAADLLKKLQEKQADAESQLEKTTDAAKKAELESLIRKIQQKRAEVAAAAKSGDPSIPKPEITLEKLKLMEDELTAKETDVRTQLGKIDDAQKKAELEEMLKKIAHKKENVKAKIEEAKAHLKDGAPQTTVR